MLQLKRAIQLESLKLPFKDSLIAAHQIGASGVEINGRTEIRPAEMTRTAVRHLKKMLTDLKLTVSSVYYPTRRGFGVADDMERRLDAVKSAMTMAYDLGAKVVVTRLGRIPEVGSDAWETMTQALTDLGGFSQKSGALLAARTENLSADTLKGLIEALPAYSLGVDFDPADYVINAQLPEEAIKTLGEHVISFRVRDATTDLKRGKGEEVQLGRGNIDWASLLGTLEEKHYSGFLTVERNADQDSLQQCAQAMEYLENLFQ